MTPKEEINQFVEKLLGKTHEEKLNLLCDKEIEIDIEDKYNLEIQLYYHYVAGLIQIVRHIPDNDFALREFRDTDNPVWYEIIHRYKRVA